VRAIGHRRQRAAEERAWRTADLCLATSEREARIIGASAARRIAIVPNGVATDTIHPVAGVPAARDAARPTLAFVGLLGYRPNADAVTHLVRDILPLIRAQRPDIHLQVIGDGATADLLRLAGPGVEFTGRVPDVRPFVSAAGAVVVPLRIGSGTRLKILEALALARPIVTTTIGAEGIDVVDGEHVLIADEPAAFAAAVVRVLRDEALARRLGENGRALVERSYDWSTVGSRLVEAYDQLLGLPA
jgi:glycosyltransferase involved in cell wall biosynthesis